MAVPTRIGSGPEGRAVGPAVADCCVADGVVEHAAIELAASATATPSLAMT
ncbi:MAG: hypothetical protein H0U86_09510 [Chloroflexi bacterium]|nr:hypothetical protein [Chloroflexota bacterium]